jgi:hypothetical protein
MSTGNALQNIGVGSTVELSLRVSVATLTRVTFPRPGDGGLMLALEHKATWRTDSDDSRIVVMAQPFGGAIRILKGTQLLTIIESFRFDSERSRAEQDFRIVIRPSDWGKLRDFCLREFEKGEESDLEFDPVRELVEEFDDALGVELRPDQYVLKAAGTLLENEPANTGNVHAAGIPTVRIYRLFEARIVDPVLGRLMLVNSEAHSSAVLRSLALADVREGGRGRANAVYITSMQRLRDAYLAISPEKRGKPVPFEGVILNGNVPAVLVDIFVPEYQIVIN